MTPEQLRARRAELAGELKAIDALLDESDCPGAGRCHGCLAWCDRCGDVSKVCDATRCDKHRCRECNEIRPPETRDFWDYICEVCDPPEIAHTPAVGDSAIDASLPTEAVSP